MQNRSIPLKCEGPDLSKIDAEVKAQQAIYKPTLDNMFANAIESMNKYISEVVDAHIRNSVMPPIKGEITKGKLRWRGFRGETLVFQSPFDDVPQRREFKLYQRGKLVDHFIIDLEFRL
jgi:hypothetical protein